MTDHFNGKTIKRLVDERPTIRIGCCEWLVIPLVENGIPKQNIDVLEIEKMYDYGAFKVSPIKLYHNVPNAGYKVYFGDEKAIYATDTEHLDGITAKDFDLYLIEANYGEDEIQERIKKKQEAGEYCYEINAMQRHLSHEQASAFLLENMRNDSEYTFLHGHIDKAKRANDWEYQDV